MLEHSYVSRATIGRIPVYLRYLKNNYHSTENISATALARALGLGEVQVRKDLSAVSGAGRPKTGYNIGKLTQALEDFLGGESNVVIVGAGKLGRALLFIYPPHLITALKQPKKATQASPYFRRICLKAFAVKTMLK